MARFQKARWRGPIPNKTSGGTVRPILGLVLHVEQGTEAGTNSWFHNPGAEASADFGNPKIGPLDQWVDTNDKAWAEMAGNTRWVSVEHEGKSGDHLTASQIENDAQLLAWLHTTEGIPLQVTNSVNKAGVGWHGMGGAAWGGHYDCPGDPIKNARPQIIARAKEIVGMTQPKGFTVAHRAVIKTATGILTRRGAGHTPLDDDARRLTVSLMIAAKSAQAVK